VTATELRRWRTNLGLTLDQFADLLKHSRRALIEWESSVRPVPPIVDCIRQNLSLRAENLRQLASLRDGSRLGSRSSDDAAWTDITDEWRKRLSGYVAELDRLLVDYTGLRNVVDRVENIRRQLAALDAAGVTGEGVDKVVGDLKFELAAWQKVLRAFDINSEEWGGPRAPALLSGGEA
jgi:hypothetical protein